METLADLVARDRRCDRAALRAGDHEQTYHRLLTVSWQAGNFLRHLGVGPDHVVAVDPTPAYQPVTTFLGASLLGARTRFGALEDEARAVVVSVDRVGDGSPSPGTRLAVFGGEPAGPATAHWEAAVWSENPAFPPTSSTPATEALVDADGSTRESWTHGELVDGATAVADALDIDEGVVVELRASLVDPAAVIAGVLAPLVAGGVAVLTDATDGAVTVDGAETGLAELPTGG